MLAPNPYAAAMLASPEAMAALAEAGGVRVTNRATNITGLVINIKGVWDLRDPVQVDELVDVVEAELITRGIGGA